MRRLIPLLLLLAPIAVFGITASALGQQDVDTVPTETIPDQEESDEEEFGRDFEEREPRQEEPPAEPPPVQPGQEPAPPSGPAPAPPPANPPAAPLPRTGADARVLAAAAYWLLLGGIALRRVAVRP